MHFSGRLAELPSFREVLSYTAKKIHLQQYQAQFTFENNAHFVVLYVQGVSPHAYPRTARYVTKTWNYDALKNLLLLINKGLNERTNFAVLDLRILFNKPKPLLHCAKFHGENTFILSAARTTLIFWTYEVRMNIVYCLHFTKIHVGSFDSKMVSVRDL